MSTRVIIGLLLVVAFWEPAGFSQTAPNRQQQIEIHSRAAAKYLQESKPELAVREFKDILAIDPTNVNARGNLGVVLFFENDYANAIPNLRAALKLQPSLPKIQALLGIAEKRTGKVDAARRDLEQAFPIVPEQNIRVQAGTELVGIYSGSGDLDKAASTVNILRELEPTDQTILYIAYRIYSDLANESLLSLSVVAPNSGRMHQALAHELAKRGETAEAIENFRAALKADPQLPGLHFELAEMLFAHGTAEGLKEAESEYKAALAADPQDEQAERRLGDIAFQRNDVQLASGHYTRALQLQPNDPEANIGLAKTLMSLDQPDRAEPLLKHALVLDPTSATAHFRLSTIYRQSGRSVEAKHEIEEYKKYNEMKEKLRALYHDLHRDQSPGDAPDSTSSP